MLGFSLLKHSFQFVEIQYQEGKPVVNQFAKRATPVPFTPNSILQNDSTDEFKRLIDEAIDYYKLNGPIIISLDSQFSMVRKIQIDLDFDDDQIDEQIRWEIRQIIPEDSLPNYQYVYEKLPNGNDTNQKALLLVLFHKDVLDRIKKMFSETPLSIQFIELDLFAAIYGVNHLYGNQENDLCFLVDLRKDDIHFVMIRNEEYFDSYRIDFGQEPEDDASEHSHESEEDLANLINKETRRKLIEYRLESDEKPVDVMYLFGENANSTIVETLESTIPAKEIVFMDPFKKLELNTPAEDSQETVPTSSEYAVCVGSALRSVL